MRPPFALDRELVGGKPVLRAANSIDSVGRGPAELAGRRDGQFAMDAFQRIHQKGGGKVERRTKADLYFKAIPGQGRYWKFKDAAKFSLFLLDGRGERVRRVEVGPKQIYCLRDLEHTHPGLTGSPNHRVYPACSQDPSRRRVELGTSVGWSDVYPSTYHENWIELNDIPKRACYAFAHTADPKNGIHEKNEKNNQASTVVFLTPGGGYKPGRCQGVRDRGLKASQTADDTEVPTEDPRAAVQGRSTGLGGGLAREGRLVRSSGPPRPGNPPARRLPHRRRGGPPGAPPMPSAGGSADDGRARDRARPRGSARARRSQGWRGRS